MIATYPIKMAQHGGQRRVAAIVEEYRKVFKSVKFVAVYSPDYYKHHGKDDIAVKGMIREETRNSPYIGDIICGQAIFSDPHVKKRMTQLLKSFKPDIIQIEQVFPYLGIKPLLKELNLDPKIILSSHNIEYTHKKSILDNSVYQYQSAEATKTIRECEQDLAKNANLITAVSAEDAKALKKMGAKSVVVAPNGIAKTIKTARSEDEWKLFKQQRGLNDIAVFIGSAHPPNWHGFLAMVGDRLGFLSNSQQLILAGSISDYFENSFNDIRPEHVTFWRRAYAAGRLSDESLAGLISESDVILLPITEGGGSNLKTAEAILSGKKIVATSYAFRSFEEYLNLPNIFIANEPNEFRNKIIEAFKTEYVDRTEEQINLANRVQWHYCLNSMVKEAVKV